MGAVDVDGDSKGRCVSFEGVVKVEANERCAGACSIDAKVLVRRLRNEDALVRREKRVADEDEGIVRAICDEKIFANDSTILC